ncbi:MAG: DUF2207 domain-containing protein [Candidatus Buchananbacteria bacterium]|nr:DUF2207 domain-containing protein [Candidatus Buchananbacteria bacterium]
MQIKIKFLIIFLLFFCWLTPAAAETIQDFSVGIGINQDATFDVREEIFYDFGTEVRHGIYRDIPVKYQTAQGNKSIKVSNISVTDSAGNLYQFTTSRVGDYLRIKIGDPDATVSGEHMYVVGYRVSRAINYFQDHDELYWNVTGNNWTVPINQVKAIVILQADALKDLRLACFSGAYGSTQPCRTAELASNANRASFSDSGFAAGDGLTVVVGFPKDVVVEPAWWQNALVVVYDNLILLLPVIVLAALYLLWRRYGKDPKGQGTIITQFDAPKDLSPAQVGLIIDENVRQRDISSEIVYLATKGYLKIHYLDDLNFFDRFSKADNYVIEKIKTGDDLPNDFQRLLMTKLFNDDFVKTHEVNGKKIAGVRLNALQEKFYKDYKDISKAVYQSMISKGYFAGNPQTIKGIYIFLGGLVVFSIFFLGGLLNPLWIMSVAISGVMIICFGFIMPQKTKAGVLLKEHVLGLKNYLKVAEKDRLAFHNAPEKKPEIFERLLPYAMVLGVETAWAAQFAGIYNQQPSWYSAPASRHLNAMILADSLDGFADVSGKVVASHPRSASSGASGFSGGFSGGGFGGGGGGSW